MPWLDDSTVYFLGGQHQLTAVRKFDGRLRWSVRLPVDRPRNVGFSGIVAGSTLFVGDEDLFAIDARSGTVLWRFGPEEAVDVGRFSPVIFGTFVLVGSANGWLYAVDVETGLPRWSTRLKAVSQVLVITSPVVDGVLYVTTVDFDSSENGEPLGGVAAIDAAKGDVIWMRDIPHHLSPIGPTATLAPVVAGGVVVAGSRDGPVYAFDRDTGELLWKLPPFPFPTVEDPSLVRDIHYLATCGNLVYIGSTSTLVAAVDANTGQEIWRTTPHPAATADRPQCDGRYVYVMRPIGGVEVLDANTGTRLWEIGHPDNDFWVGVAADAVNLYGGGELGLYALRLDDLASVPKQEIDASLTEVKR